MFNLSYANVFSWSKSKTCLFGEGTNFDALVKSSLSRSITNDFVNTYIYMCRWSVFNDLINIIKYQLED